MGALGAVEEVFFARGGRFGLGGVGGRVGDMGDFAVAGGLHTVPLAEEGRGGRGEDDVAWGRDQ